MTACISKMCTLVHSYLKASLYLTFSSSGQCEEGAQSFFSIYVSLHSILWKGRSNCCLFAILPIIISAENPIELVIFIEKKNTGVLILIPVKCSATVQKEYVHKYIFLNNQLNASVFYTHAQTHAHRHTRCPLKFFPCLYLLSFTAVAVCFFFFSFQLSLFSLPSWSTSSSLLH